MSNRSEECDLRESREERGRRPAVSSGELSSASLFSLAVGEEIEDEIRYFAGSFFEMASASVCFLNRVSGLSTPGLTLEVATGEIRLNPADGVGRPDRR